MKIYIVVEDSGRGNSNISYVDDSSCFFSKEEAEQYCNYLLANANPYGFDFDVYELNLFNSAQEIIDKLKS